MATPTGQALSAAGAQLSAERKWRASDGSCGIGFSGRILEQIRFESSRAMNGPGAQGVGGLLLGTRLGDFLRVVQYQPIVCEHSLGPDFRLSDREGSALSTQLDGFRFGTGMDDLLVLGWVVSHARGDLQITPEELRLHEKYFDSGQLALVVKPDRLGEMELAVYYAPQGSANQVRQLAPTLAVAPDASFRPNRRSLSDRRASAATQHSEFRPNRRVRPDRRISSEVEVSMPNSPHIEPPASGAVPPPAAAATRSRLLAPVLLLLLAACAGGGIYWSWSHSVAGGAAATGSQTPIEMLSLNVYENSGRFYISWNGKAEALQNASQIVLRIQDGDRLTRYELTNAEAATGVHLYQRAASAVKVTLEVHGDKGVVEESTNYTSTEFTTPALLRVTPEPAPAEVFDPAPTQPGPEK